MAVQVFYNGIIYTGEDLTEAFVIEDGLFKAVGTSKELLVSYPDAERTDLEGRFVCIC